MKLRGIMRVSCCAGELTHFPLHGWPNGTRVAAVGAERDLYWKLTVALLLRAVDYRRCAWRASSAAVQRMGSPVPAPSGLGGLRRVLASHKLSLHSSVSWPGFTLGSVPNLRHKLFDVTGGNPCRRMRVKSRESDEVTSDHVWRMTLPKCYPFIHHMIHDWSEGIYNKITKFYVAWFYTFDNDCNISRVLKVCLFFVLISNVKMLSIFRDKTGNAKWQAKLKHQILYFSDWT